MSNLLLKRALLFLSLFYLLHSNLTFAAEIKATNKISKVTLYLDRAEITRKASVSVEAGTHQIFLHDIPQTVSSESLRASGQGAKGTSILGVELREIPLLNDSSDKVQELNEKIARLNFDNQSLERAKESLEKQRSLLVSLNLNQDVPEAEKIVRPRTPKEILEILTLISDGNKKIDAELRVIQQSTDKLSKELQYLKAQLGQLQSPKKTETVIAVNISTEKAGTINLEVSYQVGQASWRPAYNLNEDNSKFSIDTYALISQKSGEDWNNVSITLSTARPQVSLLRPEPFPIILDLLHPVTRKTAGDARLKRSEEMGLSDSFNGQAMPMAAVNELEEIQTTNAAINLGAIVTYDISHSVSLKSAGTTDKVKISTHALEGKETNVIVPAQSLEVYREAILKNNTNLPFLPGMISIFSNSRFIGSRSLALTQAGEEFRLPIGVSQNITAKRTLLKKFEDDSGIVKSFRRIRNDYLIEVFNNSSENQETIILESAPVSRNEKIKVSFDDISPENLDNKDKRRISKKDGILEWHLDLSPNSKQEIRHSSIVEFPEAEIISGLDNI